VYNQPTNQYKSIGCIVSVYAQHTSCRTLGNEEHLAIGNLECTVLAVRKYPTIGLAVHGLGTQRGWSEEYALSNEGRELFGNNVVGHAHLDQRVLGRQYSLARGTIVIGARLAVSWRVNTETLVKLQFAHFVQGVELPSNKRIVVGVDVGGDERSSPIDFEANVSKVLCTTVSVL
jgi:hypothetical protein